MIFTKKYISYDVSTESESFKLEGQVVVNTDGLINDFNGSLQSLDGNYLADFSYKENDEGTYDKRISDALKSQFTDLDNFLDLAILELKSGLPE